jgi:hypothetical protein
MATFSKIYCQRHRCDRARFVTRVFRQSLYPHARLIAPVILLLHRDFFSADRALILGVADATTMQRIREEVRDYYSDSSNRGWLRHAVCIRVSGQRLKNIARRYLPEGSASSPPFPAASVVSREADVGHRK